MAALAVMVALGFPEDRSVGDFQGTLHAIGLITPVHVIKAIGRDNIIATFNAGIGVFIADYDSGYLRVDTHAQNMRLHPESLSS